MAGTLLSSYNLNTSDIYITNIRTGEKSKHTMANYTFRYSCQIVTLPDDTLVLTGGDNVNEVWNINPATEFTMTALAPMSAARFQHGSIYFDGYVYAFGGYANPVLETCERYQVDTNTWESIPSMPVGLCLIPPVAVQPTKRIYLLGGWREYKENKHIQEYDINLRAWNLLPIEMPEAGLCICSFKVGETSSQIWFFTKTNLFAFDTRTNHIRKAKTLDTDDEPSSSGGLARYYKGKLFCSFSQDQAREWNVGALRWEEVKGVLWALKTKTVLTREVIGWLGY